MSDAPMDLRHEPRMARTLHQNTQLTNELPNPDEIYAACIAGFIARRHQLGLSQKMLAANMGIDSDLVSKWENGDRRPSANMLALWAAAVDCNLGPVARSAPAGLADLARRQPRRGENLAAV
jgi:DNA-binding transcriptional regulator YiaG